MGESPATGNLIAHCIGTNSLFKYKDAVITIEGQTFAIRDLFVAAWEIIKEKTGDLVEFISEQFTLITDVWTNFPNVIDSVWGQGTFNTIRDWFTNVVNTTAEFLKWMINAFLGLSRSLMDIGQALSDIIGRLFKRMFEDIERNFPIFKH